MYVVQPVLETVTNTYIYIIIVGKSMPIDNYEQYKRVINHWETIHACVYIYILETKKLIFVFVFWCVCVCGYL